MTKQIQRFLNLVLVGLLTTTVTLSAEPVSQNMQEPSPTQASQSPDEPQKSQPTAASPVITELPEAPMPAQPVSQEPSQSQEPGSVPSGTAGAKVTPAKGAPAARVMGVAIAPAKQRGRRSLLIKVGLVAGACVAVGSVFALSKGTSAKPPGAP